MDSFWSSWIWPFLTFLVGLYFTYLLLKQWRERRKKHQLAWAVGMFIYAISASLMLWSFMKAGSLKQGALKAAKS